MLTQSSAHLVWLSIGGAAMLSFRSAISNIVVIAPFLALSVAIASMLSETPWLMLPFLGLFTGIATYETATLKLGQFGLVSQVVTLDSFYAVMFAPDEFGWGVAATFGGAVIAYLLIAIFDQWVWPDPAEAQLLRALANAAEKNRKRLIDATRYFLAEAPGRA